MKYSAWWNNTVKAHIAVHRENQSVSGQYDDIVASIMMFSRYNITIRHIHNFAHN